MDGVVSSMASPCVVDVHDSSLGMEDSSGSSESSSTEEEERLRRLFLACDRDSDGLIDCQDLRHMCQLLNVKESVDEIMNDLGVDRHGLISFEEFVRHRTQLVDEIGAVLQTVEGSDNSQGVAAGSQDFDSGERNTKQRRREGCHIVSLYELLECHEPELLHRYLECLSAPPTAGNRGMDILEVANSLHLAALSSLKGEMIELSNEVKRVRTEKDILEKQMARHQIEKLRIQKDADDRFEQQMTRYEDRITELHSVIAELRKKIDQRQINVIREEDEFEESDGLQSNKSNDADSNNDITPICSQTISIGDVGCDLNAELSRVVSELENAIDQHRILTISSHDEETNTVNSTKTASNTDRVVTSAGAIVNAGLPTSSISELEKRVSELEISRESLLEKNGLQEQELNRIRTQLGSIREERDKFRRRVHELQTRTQSTEVLPPSSLTSGSQHRTYPSFPDRGESLPHSASAQVAKVAELKKLKTGIQDRPVLGAEISLFGLPNAKVAEHLAHSLHESSSIQEILQSMQAASGGEAGAGGGGGEVAVGKIHEFEIELERLQSKVDHLKAQNDLLNLTLSESKSHCDRLTVLLGKYESNNTALQMSLNYTDQALDIYDVIVNLLDIEMAILLAKCRATGLGSRDHQNSTILLQNAHLSRRAVEAVARQLLMRLDHNGMAVNPSRSMVCPWEDSSSTSRTASTTSSTGSAEDTDFTKFDEHKLREHLRQLKADRAVVKLTIMELESVHLDPFSFDLEPNPDAQRLDLENAVLMQELMAMKEEKSELKAQNFLLEKEKALLVIRLGSKQSQNCEMREGNATSPQLDGDFKKLEVSSSPSLSLAELPSDMAKIALDLSDALRREARLKVKVQELTAVLEKVSRNSDARQQQSAGFVNELKRANSALVCAFEKAKKKYLDKMKKMEVHMQCMSERYEAQIEAMRQKMMMMDNELRRQNPILPSL